MPIYLKRNNLYMYILLHNYWTLYFCINIDMRQIYIFLLIIFIFTFHIITRNLLIFNVDISIANKFINEIKQEII